MNLAWQSLPRIGLEAFEFVEFGVVDRATANSQPRTTTGHKQVD